MAKQYKQNGAPSSARAPARTHARDLINYLSRLMIVSRHQAVWYGVTGVQSMRSLSILHHASQLLMARKFLACVCVCVCVDVCLLFFARVDLPVRQMLASICCCCCCWNIDSEIVTDDEVDDSEVDEDEQDNNEVMVSSSSAANTAISSAADLNSGTSMTGLVVAYPAMAVTR